MYRKEQYTEKTLENFKNLFEGKLDEENRWHWYRLARSYKRCNTRGSTNQANLE
jgi:hypothetical protein